MTQQYFTENPPVIRELSFGDRVGKELALRRGPDLRWSKRFQFSFRNNRELLVTASQYYGDVAYQLHDTSSLEIVMSTNHGSQFGHLRGSFEHAAKQKLLLPGHFNVDRVMERVLSLAEEQQKNEGRGDDHRRITVEHSFLAEQVVGIESGRLFELLHVARSQHSGLLDSPLSLAGFSGETRENISNLLTILQRRQTERELKIWNYHRDPDFISAKRLIETLDEVERFSRPETIQLLSYLSSSVPAGFIHRCRKYARIASWE